MLDHFQMGPNLVRGFAPSGIGPRDLTPGTTQDALGGSMYWGSSVEFQTPLFFAPKEVGHYMPDIPKGAEMASSNDVTIDERGLIYLIDRIRGVDIIETSVM